MEFGFIEVELERPKGGDMAEDEIVSLHDRLKLAVQDKEGLNQLEWAKFRKAYVLSEGKNQNIEDYEKLNKSQRWFCHQFSLAVNSIEE